MNKYKRLSLYYLAFYLCGGGLGLAIAPRFALKMLFASGDYGEVFPRFAGMMVLALGVLVVQILRKELFAIFHTLIVVRMGLCAAWIVLFSAFRDPFFLALLGIVGLGVALSLMGDRLDARNRPSTDPPRTDAR